MKLVITKPDGTTRTRFFDTRALAAEHGVRYYLLDNCHAPYQAADGAAAQFSVLGSVSVGGFTFTEVQ